MKSLHYSIITVLIVSVAIVVIIEFPIPYFGTTMIVPSRPHVEFDNTLHGLSDSKIGLVLNGILSSRDTPVYVKQGQNLTLVANVTSDPTNSPVSLDIDSHVGFTKTNGIDSKLSTTKINTPGQVMIYVSASKDATPNTYQILVRANNTQMTMNTNFYVKVIPSNENLPTAKNTASNPNPLGVTALVVYSPPDACLGMHCPPYTFYLKINSNSTAYLLGYNICDGESCTKSNDLSVLLPINVISKPDYQMIGLPVDLQWKYGDIVHIQLEVSSNDDNKTASPIDLGNSTIVP